MPRVLLRRRRHRLSPLAAALAAALVMGGCASNTTTVATAEPTYTASYAEGRYEQAYRDASAAAGRPGAGAAAEAGLIAGLSAHALDRPEEARRWLEPLTGHADPSISGRASAALGLIAQNRGEHPRAAALLADAAGRLGGNQGARAALYAGDSYAAMGRADEARRQYERAAAMVTSDAALQGTIASRLSGGRPTTAGTTAGAAAPAASGPYSIQLGAFSSAERAASLAREASARARAAGIGEARTFQSRDRTGRTLHFVRVGYFPSRTAAADARSRLGMGGVVAETAGEGR